MTHAWLIIAHNEWKILQCLLSMLDAKGCDFYVHIDSKVRDLPLLNVEKGRLFMLKDRVDVRWGSFSQIRCELALFQAASAQGPYDFYHIISGVTLPLKSIDEIGAWFEKRKGMNIFCGLCRSTPYQETLKLRRYNLFLSGYASSNPLKRNVCQSLWKGAIAFQRYLGIQMNKGRTFWKASNWISVTEEAVQYLLAHRKEIHKTYRFSFCGDEYFVPSVLNASPLKGSLINEEHYLLHNIGRSNAGTFSLEEMDSLRETPYLFARKFTQP